MSKSVVVCNLAPLEALNLDIAANEHAYVKVGILGVGRAGRPAHPTRKEAGIDNPNLGAVHEFGSMKRHIPPRSFLRMPLMTKLPDKMRAIGKAVWQSIIDQKGIRTALADLGAEGENTVQEAFNTGGFGQWAPWSEKYGRRRELEMRAKRRKKRLIGPMQLAILVRTGQLAKAITSHVVGGKAQP